jgi:hypothetical protein
LTAASSNRRESISARHPPGFDQLSLTMAATDGIPFASTMKSM